MRTKLLKNLPNKHSNFIKVSDLLTTNEYKLIGTSFNPYYYYNYLNDSQLIVSIIDNKYYLTLRYNDHYDDNYYVNLTFKKYNSLNKLIQDIPETIRVNTLIFDAIEDFLPKFHRLIRYKNNRKKGRKDYCSYHIKTLAPLHDRLLDDIIDVGMRKYKGYSFNYGGYTRNEKDATKLTIML